VGFATRIINAIRTSRAVTSIAQWLSDLEAYAPVSTTTPSAVASAAGLPKTDELKGLRGVCELKLANGSIEWQFFWSNDWAADRGEIEYQRLRGSAVFTRAVIRCANVSKPAWWRRTLSWTVATGFLASAAAVGANVESIKNLYSQLRHRPVVRVESNQALLAGSDLSREAASVTIRGDPYFITRVEKVKMVLSPESTAVTLPDNGVYRVSDSNVSLGISAQMPLLLPLGKLPPGGYKLTLTGKVSTGWNSAELVLDKPLHLEVRNPMSLRMTDVNPVPGTIETDGKFEQGLADFALDFGHLHQSSVDVRIVLKGAWIAWSTEYKPPKAEVSAESDNSKQHPKSIIFSLKSLQGRSFLTDTFRVKAIATQPMTRGEWLAKFAGSTAQITNLE
jgi:hypothetical protein